jgi:hypothetical protein
MTMVGAGAAAARDDDANCHPAALGAVDIGHRRCGHSSSRCDYFVTAKGY